MTQEARSELDDRCLDAFSAWLSSLGDDVRALTRLLDHHGLNTPAREQLVTGLNYLFKSLDLIPDGIEDLGFLDDAFVLREVASQMGATESQPLAGGVLAQLAKDAELIGRFLGDDYARLQAYVRDPKLKQSVARGRSAESILQDPKVCSEFLRELRAWSESYAAPTFVRDPKTLVKLKAFLVTKLSA